MPLVTRRSRLKPTRASVRVPLSGKANQQKVRGQLTYDCSACCKPLRACACCGVRKLMDAMAHAKPRAAMLIGPAVTAHAVTEVPVRLVDGEGPSALRLAQPQISALGLGLPTVGCQCQMHAGTQDQARCVELAATCTASRWQFEQLVFRSTLVLSQQRKLPPPGHRPYLPAYNVPGTLHVGPPTCCGLTISST